MKTSIEMVKELGWYGSIQTCAQIEIIQEDARKELLEQNEQLKQKIKRLTNGKHD